MLEAILFDLDGTLVDSRRDLATAVNLALGELGLPVRSLDEVTGDIGEGARRLMEKSLGGEAIAARAGVVEIALAAWERHYARVLLHETASYAGIAELLARLEPRSSLAVHTNKPGGFARPILEGLGIARHFREVLGGGDGPERKPSPAGVRVLLERLGCPIERAVYVGDSEVDFATARAAGIPFLGVAWGFSGEARLRAAGAERVARDVAELEALLLAES